jgi:hypothetical protein
MGSPFRSPVLHVQSHTVGVIWLDLIITSTKYAAPVQVLAKLDITKPTLAHPISLARTLLATSYSGSMSTSQT